MTVDIYVALTAGFALSVLHILTQSSQQPYDVYTITIPILQMRKLRPNEVKKEHAISKWRNWDLHTDILTL